MAGKFVGVDWYNGDYGVFEKHGEKYIPVKFSKEIYDCINYVCCEYDHLDTIEIPVIAVGRSVIQGRKFPNAI